MRRYQLQSVQYLCSSYTFTFLLSSQWITEMCAVNFQAQKTVAELQAQLDLLKDSSESPQSDTEDVAQLKVRNGYNSVLLENSNHCLFVLFKLNKVRPWFKALGSSSCNRKIAGSISSSVCLGLPPTGDGAI